MCIRDSGHPRQVDPEHASVPREIARRDPAAVHFGAPSAERESETEARPIRAPSFERLKQHVCVPVREAAAFVLDLDAYAIRGGNDAQADARSRAGELEGVL